MKINLQKILSFKIAVIVLLILGAAEFTLHAQTLRSDIKGYVRDIESGEALPYANITVKGTRRGSATNTDGYFILVNEPVGKCTLSGNYIGYTAMHLEVENLPGASLPLIIELKPTVLELEGASVIGETPILESSQDEISQNLIVFVLDGNSFAPSFE